MGWKSPSPFFHLWGKFVRLYMYGESSRSSSLFSIWKIIGISYLHPCFSFHLILMTWVLNRNARLEFYCWGTSSFKWSGEVIFDNFPFWYVSGFEFLHRVLVDHWRTGNCLFPTDFLTLVPYPYRTDNSSVSKRLSHTFHPD